MLSRPTVRLALVAALALAPTPFLTTFGSQPDAVRRPTVVVNPRVSTAGNEAAQVAGSFLETFDGAPPAPTPWSSPNWDITVHSRDVATFPALEVSHAGHGPDCSPPPATHETSGYADAVFLCRDHLMTAIKAEGYGVIYLTPDQLADFSLRETVIRFDVSTLRTSDRDWIDLWVTPFDDNVQLVGDIGAVDLNGSPRNAVQIRMDQVGGTTVFRGNVVRGFASQALAGTDASLEALLQASAAVRTTFELHLSRTHVRFGIPALNAWWVDTDIADLGWTRGIVQLGHHSYNPEKADGCGPPVGVSTCTANTWHWDNVGISPVVPFTILASDRRTADASGPEFSFAPAPANSHLRFTGIGRSLALSYDGGLTWQPARLQAYEQQLGEEHFSSYWTSIPAGTRRVRFRAADWFGGTWLVRNASIWSPDGSPTAPAPVVPPPSSGGPVGPPPPGPLPIPITPSPSTPSPSSGGPAGPPPGLPPIPVAPSPSTPIPASAAGLHSSWQDQSAYPVLAPGSVASITIRYKNTGTELWQVGISGRQVNLGVSGDSLTVAALGMAERWLGPNRLATTQESAVAPGEIGTFRFDVRAPASPGLYRMDLRLVDDGVAWLDDQGVYLVVVSDYGLHSAWTSQTAWPTLRRGESTTVSLSFRNTGTRPWVRGPAGQQVNIGVVGDGGSWKGSAVAWPSPDRPAVQAEDIVPPGGIGTFTFQLSTPTEVGVRDLHLQLVVDGVTWLNDQGVFVRVTVVP